MHSVTAILVNYLGAADIVLAAQSVRVDAPTANIVVIDNSECVAQVAHLRTHLPVGVELLVAPTNLGFGAACNWGAAHRPADGYFLVNPDVRVLPGCLEPLVSAMACNSRIGAIAPTQFLDEAQAWRFSPAWLPSALGAWARELAVRSVSAQARLDRAVRAESFRLWAAGEGAMPLRQRALSGAALLVRHECLDPRFGLFDPRYFMYYEDSDLCVRLRRQGWQLAVLPGAKALHLWQMGGHKHDLMALAAPVFFGTHHANSVWLERTRHTQQMPVPVQSHVEWRAGEPLPVPETWQSGWMLELSPLLVFLPSVGCLGAGPVVQWPISVAMAAQGVQFYARLTPLGACHTQSKVVALMV